MNPPSRRTALRITLAAAILTTATACGSSSADPAVCDPVAPVSLPLTRGPVIAAGKDAAGVVYLIDEGGTSGQRLFVSASAPSSASLVLERRVLKGSGSIGGTGPGGYLIVDALDSDGTTDLHVAVAFGAAGPTSMGLLRGPLSDKTFAIGSAGITLTLLDAAVLAPYALVNLPGTFNYEHVAALPDGRRLVVISPAVDTRYEDFRVFFGPADHLLERPLVNVSRGSYTVVAFTVDGQEARATIASALSPAVVSELALGGETQPLTVAASGSQPEGVTYYCTTASK